MASGGTMAAGWRARRSLVVGALLASLLAVAPIDAQEGPPPTGDSSELSVDVATPDEVVDGAATVEGTVTVGGEEVVTDTSAVLVFDVSGSARWDAADCTGDGSVDSMLTCERVAMRVFVEAAAEVGSVGEVAAVAFGTRSEGSGAGCEGGLGGRLGGPPRWSRSPVPGTSDAMMAECSSSADFGTKRSTDDLAP